MANRLTNKTAMNQRQATKAGGDAPAAKIATKKTSGVQKESELDMSFLDNHKKRNERKFKHVQSSVGKYIDQMMKEEQEHRDVRARVELEKKYYYHVESAKSRSSAIEDRELPSKRGKSKPKVSSDTRINEIAVQQLKEQLQEKDDEIAQLKKSLSYFKEEAQKSHQLLDHSVKCMETTSDPAEASAMFADYRLRSGKTRGTQACEGEDELPGDDDTDCEEDVGEEYEATEQYEGGDEKSYQSHSSGAAEGEDKTNFDKGDH